MFVAHFSRSSLACPWCFIVHPSRSLLIHPSLIGIPRSLHSSLFHHEFIRSVFQSFVGLGPQLQHPPPTEPPLPDTDFNFSPIDEIEFNPPPPTPSPEPAPRSKQRSMKARPQPSAHRRQTRPASPDEPMDDGETQDKAHQGKHCSFKGI